MLLELLPVYGNAEQAGTRAGSARAGPRAGVQGAAAMAARAAAASMSRLRESVRLGVDCGLRRVPSRLPPSVMPAHSSSRAGPVKRAPFLQAVSSCTCVPGLLDLIGTSCLV